MTSSEIDVLLEQCRRSLREARRDSLKCKLEKKFGIAKGIDDQIREIERQIKELKELKIAYKKLGR